jgi:hypothetical protein
MKSKKPTRLLPDTGTREDEKMYKIVDEVDRFFKSVHADIEDWKFSMEDHGDGTRVFVRFQIHFDQSAVSADSTTSDERKSVVEPEHGLSIRGAGAGPTNGSVTATVHEPAGTRAGRRAELDLASFVNLWKHKRDSSLHGEFHKKGAPDVDARAETPRRT